MTKTTAQALDRRRGSEEKLAIVDVRTPAEFEEEHIEGSRLIPLDRIDEEALRREAGEASEVVFVCGTGKRAGQACEKLKGVEGKAFEVLEGGLSAWQSAGLPVKRGRRTMSLERQVRIAAGVLVVIGVVLGIWVHAGFFGLSAFVGLGLIFAGLTDWCGMGMLLAKMPWNQR